MFDEFTHRLARLEQHGIEKLIASSKQLVSSKHVTPKFWQSNWPYILSVLSLSFPLIITYLADVAIIPSVIAVVGRLGVASLSAIVSFEIMAKLLSEKAARTLTPTITRIAAAQSRGDEKRVRIEAGSCVALAFILGLIVSIASLFIPNILYLAGQSDEIINLTSDYAEIAAWRLLIATLIAALRVISLGLEDTIVSSVVPIPGLLVAVGLTAMLISNNDSYFTSHYTSLGIRGAAWGLLLAYIYMLISLVWSIYEHQARLVLSQLAGANSLYVASFPRRSFCPDAIQYRDRQHCRAWPGGGDDWRGRIGGASIGDQPVFYP